MSVIVPAGTLLLRAVLVAIVFVAVRRGDVAAGVNGVFAVLVSFLPALFEFAAHQFLGRGVVLGPELALWLTVAGCLHAYGMLGPYDSVWWWDHLTHAVSAMLVAAVVYAVGLVVAPRLTVLPASTSSVALLTVSFVLGAGVFWELIEAAARAIGDRVGVEPVLVQYGWRDTAFDLVFDVLGALVVVLLDVRLFVPVAESVPNLARTLLLAGGLLVTAGSVGLAVGLLLTRTVGPASGG